MRQVLLLAFVLSCTRGAPLVDLPTPDEVAREHDSVRLDATLRRMSLVRELQATHDVERVVLPRPELLAKVKEHVARAVPRDVIAHEQLFLKAMGVLDVRDDYEQTVYAALHGSTGGMYEPFDKKMYLPDDLAPSSLAIALAHESVHALQDQHFGLEAIERYVPGASDTMLARSCLAEGDAMNATAEADTVDATGASYVEREILAPYVTGAAFVRALRRRGGWALVNTAWTRGSLTTEQILHPNKWLAEERALDVPAPTFATLGPQATRVATDVRGELGLRLVLESAVPHASAAAAASGWGGDTLVIVRDGSSVALAWRIRFDDDASAQSAFPTLSEAFAARACSVTASARDVLILVGPPRETCSRWSKEILISSPP